MKFCRNFACLFGAMLLPGCSSSDLADDALADKGCVSASCQAAGADSKADYVLQVEAGAGGAASEATDSSGVVSACDVVALGCNPDVDSACSDMDGESNGGVSGSGSASGGAATGGAGAGGAAVGVGLACRITFEYPAARSQCATAGSGIDGSTCSAGADCAAGYGCVSDNGTSQCRHYCCSGEALCGSGSYCGERAIVDSVEGSGRFFVAVCLPGVVCRFDEPYPCPADQSCSCPTGTTCGVVRADGTTACVTPGTGVEGDSCPCAAGHVCSDATGTCMKTCHVANATESAEECAAGVCQDSTSLPEGVGICVSSAVLT